MIALSIVSIADEKEAKPLMLNFLTQPLGIIQMEKELKEQKDPRMFRQGRVFDQYPYVQSKVRDYYNRFKKGGKIKAGWISESDYED